MKDVIFSWLMLVASASGAYGQEHKEAITSIMPPPLPLTDNKIVYTAIITVNTFTGKEALFAQAEQWYKNNFETADNRLTTDNAVDNKLSGTGIIHAGTQEQKAGAGDIFFTIDLHIARDMYEYVVHDIYGFDKTGKFYYSDMYNEALYPPAKPKWDAAYRHDMLNNMNNEIIAMVTKLQEEMNKEK